MKEWVLFALFLFVGVSMFFEGISRMRKEKSDTETAKIYFV